MTSNRDESQDSPFRTLGTLAKQISTTLETSGSTPTASSPTSGNGPQTPVPPKPANQIGRYSGRAGAVARQIGLAEALTGASPEATDRALLASLPPPLARQLVPIYEDRTTEKHGWDEELVGYRTIGPIDALEARTAKSPIFEALAACTPEIASYELARLRSMVAKRSESDDDMEFGFGVLIEELQEYPPDVVRFACRKWARLERWWPTWSELREFCERGVRPRRALRRLLG